MRWDRRNVEFFRFPTQEISRCPFGKIDNNWCHYCLFWLINPSKPRVPTSDRQFLHWEVKRPNFPKSWTCSQLFFMKKNSIRLGASIRSKSNCLKSPSDVRLNHCLLECPIDLEQEIGCTLVIAERQFILFWSFEDSKQ
jgi:hypothetical protein